MIYVCTGRVHPERAGVWFTDRELKFPEGWRAKAVCTGSQIIITLVNPPWPNDLDIACTIAKDIAEFHVAALGFSLGLGYSVEIFQVTDQNGNSKIFGAAPLGGEQYETLQIAPDHLPIFKQATDMSENTYFRLAIRDYVKAITDVMLGAFYCYRCLEAIRSAFPGNTESDQWDAMHAALETDRNTIQKMVKQYADPLRHGNWEKTKPVTLSNHNQILRFTRDILVRYMDHVS